MREYLGIELGNAEIAEIVPDAMRVAARFNPIVTRQELQVRGFRPWQIFRFAYRPFDIRWIYWEPTTKLLDEKRSEYVQQTNFSGACLVAQQKSRGESSPPQFISQLGCLDLLDRGASCFPGTIVETAGTLLSEIHVSTNISPAASLHIGHIGGAEADLLFHSLAITHTPRYRSENLGALLGDWPHIPLPATSDLLNRSAALGRRLGELLDAESAVQFGTEWTFVGALKLPRASDLSESLKITADWGRRGQGSTVMPASGHAIARQWTDEEREKIARLAAARSLTSSEVLALLGANCMDIYLNGGALWLAVPSKVWNYSLGGYQVLKKWLSYREFDLLGRALSAEEAAYFSQVVRRISAILLMGPELDANYQSIVPTAIGLSHD